jgi:hypothetical protein
LEGTVFRVKRLLLPLSPCVFLILGCKGGDQVSGELEAGLPERDTGQVVEDVFAGTRRPGEGTPADWEILREKATWGWELGLDTLPIGEAMAFLGLSFVGTRYAPGTLEGPGPEELVVNLQELDCVTFVENVLALARFLRLSEPRVLDSEIETRNLYRRIITDIRYRGGRIDGYSSRLHYFSDWILDNEEKGLVREITQELGGEEDSRAVDFMSSHPDAYPQLARSANLQAIRERELFLSSRVRYRIAQDRIEAGSDEIKDGDIIAATSAVEGLEVGHTGLAVWRDGALHLLHAPLVGESVEVSALPLAERILRIESQDGIRVVRPLEPGPRRAGREGAPTQ